MYQTEKSDPIRDLLKNLEASGKLKKKERGPSKNTDPIKRQNKVVLYVADVHPKLIVEWHPTKNGLLTPYNVSYGSHQEIWWICSSDETHVWSDLVYNRHKGNKCPLCPRKSKSEKTSLMAFPELVREWHPTKNNELTPNDLAQTSRLKVWWLCAKDATHEWEASVYKRVKGTKCPYCVGQKILPHLCLAVTNPELAKELHPQKNGLVKAENINIKYWRKQFWWICPNDKQHIWKCSIDDRLAGVSCSRCVTRPVKKIGEKKSLAKIKPELIKYWHPTKNAPLTPSDTPSRSTKYVWWLCPKDGSHEWLQTVGSQTEACPLCTKLSVVYPELAKEFHPRKNFPLEIEKIRSDRVQPVWWQCKKNKKHEWKASVKNRVIDQNCPECLKEERTSTE